MARWRAAALLVLSSGCTPPSSKPGGPEPTPTATAATPTPTAEPTPPGEVTLVGSLPHSGWSEGLDVYGGELWHAFPHSHRVFDLESGEERRRYDPPSEYSESLAWIEGELWNVSYSDSNLWVGTPSGEGFTWRIVGTTPEVHAWGITFDGTHVIVTGNGSPRLYFLHPATSAVVRVLETAIDDLEDLAWDRGAIWASSYSELSGSFFRLDPSTGAVLEAHALPDETCAIVDGIAVADGLLYVTGKDCVSIWVYALP